MTRPQHDRLIEALIRILPLPQDCPDCDPGGGCPDPRSCREILADDVILVCEKEGVL